MFKIVAAAVLSLTAVTAAPAVATVLLVDEAGFEAGAPGPRETQAIDFNGTSRSVTLGPITFTAESGQIFGNGVTLSPDEAGTALNLSFDQPLLALAIDAGVQDGASFDFVDGRLGITVTELGGASDNLELVTTGERAAFLGLLSNVGIRRLSLSIIDFDADATSAPFVALTGSAELSPVPLPAAAALLLPALGGLAFAARRRG